VSLSDLRINQMSKTEITKLCCPIFIFPCGRLDKYILKFDVIVNNSLVVNIFESFKHVLCKWRKLIIAFNRCMSLKKDKMSKLFWRVFLVKGLPHEFSLRNIELCHSIPWKSHISYQFLYSHTATPRFDDASKNGLCIPT
jgi:hypothetical protein